MKQRLLTLMMALAVLVSVVVPAAAAQPDGEQGLTILFTHDLHDHILPTADAQGGEYGGFARLATLLEQEREAARYPVVTLDGGDFSMGTLYQTVFTSRAPALRLMGAMGYDVTTLGNHEFDYRAAGLAKMLQSARESGDVLPRMVEANYRVDFNGEDTQNKQALADALEDYPVTDYTILERDGLRVAVFGLMGEDSHACAPMSGMALEDLAQAAERTVNQIREQENADFIICLSHSGTTGGQGEDYELAKAVDGIDVIISGHTHTLLNEPIEVNNTYIVSCGEYGKNLGVMNITKSGDTVALEDYRLIPVNETVAEDPAIAALAETYKTCVEDDYLSDYGYTFDQVLTTNPVSFTPFREFGQEQGEDTLGNLIADSYVYAVKQAEGENYIPVDFAVTAVGVIRDSLSTGEITVTDAFNVSSLGSGADGTAGYPLVSVYLTGRELKDAFEIDATVSLLMPTARLYGSGMTWTFNTNRMFFNRVVACAQMLEDGSVVELEDERMYRVVSGLYCAQMLGQVNEKSFGLLSITPKDAQGNPVTDFEDHIIKMDNGSELKEWYALVSYLDSMDEVSERYAQSEGRKVVYSSWNPIELLKNANRITLVALAVILLIILILILIVRAIARRGRRSRYGSGYGGLQGMRVYHGRRKR